MKLSGNGKDRIQRKLVLRLSSLGDVILASSVLGTQEAQNGVDWVVAQEYAAVLKGHPKLLKLWEFRRASGLIGWIGFCRELWKQNYDEVYDLHRTLRSKIARILFFLWGLRKGGQGPRWIVFSKQRWKLYGYFFFKKLWPKKWRPDPVVERFNKTMGGVGTERPDLTHLLKSTGENFPELSRPYFCIMPGAQWRGKRWPVKSYITLVKNTGIFPVILGGQADQESFELHKELEILKIPHLSGVGKWDLAQVAAVLARSCGYIGGDTGLAHLAESAGVPAWVIYGPTVPDMGFGPWRSRSRSFGADLWCRPCGKDGRFCFRVKQRYLCLSSLRAEQVASEISRLC